MIKTRSPHIIPTMKIEYKLKPLCERRTTPLDCSHPLGFGQLRTDHMFLMDYENGQWQNLRIQPYGELNMMPGATALHYGQSVFEGAKAFLHNDNEIYTFRLTKNCERLNQSADILCMPQVPVEVQMQAIHSLLDVDRIWMPKQAGASMYIRPFLFATDDNLSVRPSEQYTYCVMLSPSGAYYEKGIKDSISLLVSTQYHRAVSGGTGAAKAAGNYAASLRAQRQAQSLGAAQVLYLDASNTYLEEAGAMNHFHITKENELIIPFFTDTILKSITSQSILTLGEQLGLTVKQQQIKLSDFINDIQNGNIIEAGGFGTAAVCTAVGHYLFEDGRRITVGDGNVGPIIKRLYETYTGLQQGKIAAPTDWLEHVASAQEVK